MPQNFQKVGNCGELRYMETRVTHEEAKRQCEAIGSRLVEFWNHAEWNEVKIELTFLFIVHV